LNEYLRCHPGLRDEIEKRTGTVHGLEDNSVQEDDCHDDSDVPSSAVIHDQLGISISDTTQASNCVMQARKDGDHGGLVADDDEENVWTWDDSGEKWGDDPPMTDNDS
jgi:hypothetical protein